MTTGVCGAAIIRRGTPRIALAATLLSAVLASPLAAQDLDPRAYANVPVDATFLVSGFSVSRGGVLSDPTLPITDLSATIETASLGMVRTFSLFGRTAQAFGVLPYSWAQLSGNVLGVGAGTTRAGLSDARVRVSVLVRGAPASTLSEMLKAPRRTILGTSLTVAVPTGEHSADKLLNLGTHRWGFKPEFAVSQPIRQRWLLDAYAGVWLFTANDSFYPGNLVRRQAPLTSFQAHLSYNFSPLSWAAFDATYYTGGRTSIQGVANDDRQANSRIGATVVLPVGRRHAIKVAATRGAIIRHGADFSTISFAWQTGFVSPTGASHGPRRARPAVPSGRTSAGSHSGLPR